MSLLLGIDLGSSSLKAALVDAATGRCVASASYPESEAPIKALQPGWAEQRPDDWWQYLKLALSKLSTAHCPLSTTHCPLPTTHCPLPTTHCPLPTIEAIGISYQMHGLVCLDKDLKPLRDAIIWCDSRGVPYGERAFREVGEDYCMSHLLNSPGNFTAAKLAWVKEHEPELFDKIRYIMLPGDYLALRLTGTPATTACGLSEMMLVDFGVGSTREQMSSATHYPLSTKMMEYFGFPQSIIPPLVPTFGEQGRLTESEETIQ